jgi:hypothetical protein
MVFQARGLSLMAALGPGVGICGRPGGLKKKIVLREMDVESNRPFFGTGLVIYVVYVCDEKIRKGRLIVSICMYY